MKKEYFFIAVVISIIVIAPIYFSLDKEVSKSQNRICFSETCVYVKLAQTLEERERGLMFVEKLSENSGMLFIFEKPDRHGFWMKNTLIPLDIIWLDENLKVANIENAPPCSTEQCDVYIPDTNAKYVLEVNLGFAEKNKIKVGDGAVLE